MKDLYVELLDAKTNKVYKENEFERLLLSLDSLSKGLTVNWDSGRPVRCLDCKAEFGTSQARWSDNVEWDPNDYSD